MVTDDSANQLDETANTPLSSISTEVAPRLSTKRRKSAVWECSAMPLGEALTARCFTSNFGHFTQFF